MRHLVLIFPLLLVGCGFAGSEPVAASDPPGFMMGIWHGLVAPWSFIARLFLEVKMYAVPNAGWTYDLGFLIGIPFSFPVGWVAALVALIVHLF